MKCCCCNNEIESKGILTGICNHCEECMKRYLRCANCGKPTDAKGDPETCIALCEDCLAMLKQDKQFMECSK